MEAWIVVIVVVVLIAVAVAAGLAWWFGRERKSESLRERFGPEYDRTVEDASSRAKAERELRARERRIEKLDIRPLGADRVREARREWEETERDFVDDPADAVRRAHRLLITVMRERGYPVEDFDQRAADLSVNHPEMVEHYRAAHDIVTRNSDGQADTEDLRQAVIHYRALFRDLLEPDQARKEAS